MVDARPLPLCVPSTPLHDQERGVQVADSEPQLEASGCRIKQAL